MGKTLAERGISGGKLNTLRSAMIRTAGGDFEFIADKEMKYPQKEEYIVLVRTDFKTEGIFIFLRNAFAHGEFKVTNGWYFLENHSSNGDIKGKAILRETTLLKWIDIVNMPIEDMKTIK